MTLAEERKKKGEGGGEREKRGGRREEIRGRDEFVKLHRFVMKSRSKMIHSLDLGSVINRFTAAKSINCSRRR